jgi:hypothetical protein
MKEPRRHAANDRNRKKAGRQINRVLDELGYLYDRISKLLGHVEYATSKADKLRNRLKSERDKCGAPLIRN